jgi:hypothetical protein
MRRKLARWIEQLMVRIGFLAAPGPENDYYAWADRRLDELDDED